MRSPSCAVIRSAPESWPSAPTGPGSPRRVRIRTTVVRLWEAATGRPIAAMDGHTNTIRSVAFGPDGRRIVSGSLDETARLWDGRRPAGRHRPRPHRSAVGRDLQPRRQAGRDGLGRSDAAALGRDFRRSGRRLAGPPCGGPSVAFAARLAAGVALKRRRDALWDMELAERNGILRRHGSFVYDVTFSPDGAGGLRGLGRHGAALGCEHRPSNRRAATRTPSDRRRNRQFRGLAPQRQSTGHRDTCRHDHTLGSGHRQTPPGLKTPTGRWTGDAGRSSTRRARCWPRGAATARCGSGT